MLETVVNILAKALPGHIFSFDTTCDAATGKITYTLSCSYAFGMGMVAQASSPRLREVIDKCLEKLVEASLTRERHAAVDAVQAQVLQLLYPSGVEEETHAHAGSSWAIEDATLQVWLGPSDCIPGWGTWPAGHVRATFSTREAAEKCLQDVIQATGPEPWKNYRVVAVSPPPKPATPTGGLWRKRGTVPRGGKYLVLRRDGTVPEWPGFVIGARDPAAPAALRAYANAAEKLGFDARYVEDVRELAKDFEVYRAEHGEGDPTAPPHRKDDPDIIAKMTNGGM